MNHLDTTRTLTTSFLAVRVPLIIYIAVIVPFENLYVPFVNL